MPDLLRNYIRTEARKPFRFGPSSQSLDCAQFAWGWAELLSGTKPGRHFVYTDARQARDIIRRAGGLRWLGRRLADEIGWVQTEAPRPGDIGLVRYGRRKVFGICVGDRAWAVKTVHGAYIGPAEHVAAWSSAPGGAVNAEVIGAAFLNLLGIGNFGITIFGSTVSAASIVGQVVITAASIAAAYLLRPSAPKPADQHQTIRQSNAPRIRHYGTCKVGGVAAFWESKAGRFYRVIMTGSGRMDQVLEHWLNDKEVEVSGRNVTTTPLNGFAFIDHRLGLDTETAYAELMARFPGEWTADHRLDGISSVLLELRDPGARRFMNVFQAGIPNYRQVGRYALVYDPRDDTQDPDDPQTWKWSDNVSLQIRDFLTHRDGFHQSRDLIHEPSFIAHANLCDELVPLKAGGFERRYRGCGSYSFGEPRKDTLRRMLEACDSQIFIRADGLIGIIGGRFEEPVVTIDDRCIIARSWEMFGTDAAEVDRFNELKPVFVSPAHDYQEVEAAAFKDEAAITRGGLESRLLPLPWVPAHTQAQRIATIAGRRMLSPCVGTLTCNAAGLKSFQQYIIRVVDSFMGIDGSFQIDPIGIELSADERGGVTLVVTIKATQVFRVSWLWDPATDEGDAPPVPPNTSTDVEIETPAAVTVAVAPVQLAEGVVGAQLDVSWAAPSRSGMQAEVRYRQRISATPPTYGPYVTRQVEADDRRCLSDVIQIDGSLYEIDVVFVVTGGARGEPSPVETVYATTDPVAPDPVEGLSLSPGEGEISAEWTASGGNFAAARVYVSETDTLTGATLIDTIYGAPSSAQSRVIADLTPGTWWVLVVALNGSLVPAAPVSASATVT